MSDGPTTAPAADTADQVIHWLTDMALAACLRRRCSIAIPGGVCNCIFNRSSSWLANWPPADMLTLALLIAYRHTIVTPMNLPSRSSLTRSTASLLLMATALAMMSLERQSRMLKKLRRLYLRTL
jgi:hypothetical protein